MVALPLFHTPAQPRATSDRRGTQGTLTRTQLLVLGFFLLAWISVVAVLIAAPEVYDQTLKLPPGDGRGVDFAFLAALSAFLVVLAIGVVRRWRWLFWLILLAFLAGVLRVPAALLELAGILPATGPVWYVVYQAIVGLLQVVVGVAMLAGYRRGGAWADF